ncbi:hypothetical protein [Rhodococcus sp. NPDC127528]|uniref:hypothetical protein n=1 Tax=unclassified Rhodococcus (in: high G+C Gram-positive bacteria) TaxID=192944 RepID=UPI0036448810
MAAPHAPIHTPSRNEGNPIGTPTHRRCRRVGRSRHRGPAAATALAEPINNAAVIEGRENGYNGGLVNGGAGPVVIDGGTNQGDIVINLNILSFNGNGNANGALSGNANGALSGNANGTANGAGAGNDVGILLNTLLSRVLSAGSWRSSVVGQPRCRQEAS